MTIPTKTMPTQNAAGRAAREFTEKEREFVRQHHRIYTMRQIGDALEISMHQVGRLLHELNLTIGVKKNNKSRSLNEPWSKQADSEIFDVHEMEWL